MAEEPPVKKAKHQDMDSFIQGVIQSKSNLSAVMDDVYTNTLPLTKCYVGLVKDKKQLSMMILLLNEKLPLKSLQHLKRVYKRFVLICSISDFHKMTDQSVQDYLDTNIPEMKNAFDYIKEIDLPALAPLTKKQCNESRHKWSCNFHPTPHIEALMSDSYFNRFDLPLHRTYMGIALVIAKIFMKDNGTVQDLSNSNANAAVVVDPTARSVVAIAIDNRIEHPMQHATMVAIDNVAKSQNGGAWDDNQLTKDTIFKIRQKFINVPFGSRKFVSKKEETGDNTADNSPYLCTGYDIYLVREPCVMCAMGLVHARIKRVFFAIENATFGALKSKTKLHCVRHLNHRFEVFNGFEN